MANLLPGLPARPKTMSSLPQVILKPRRALPFFKRHPWVFAGAINRIEGDAEVEVVGDEVALVSKEGKFIARGLVNSNSNIAVRLYSWDNEIPLDKSFWSQRLDIAIRWREKSFDQSNKEAAYRVVFSEADGLSGLIVDRYSDWLVVQFTSQALFQRMQMIVELLEEKLKPKGIWLRTEKGVREAEGLTANDQLIIGTPPPRPLFIEEHGIRYGVDVVEGQKTGFFLDQRDNRAEVGRLVKNHRVLDLFCYTGGFSLSACLLGQAKEVVGVDISKSAIQMAQANAALNSTAERIRFETANVFDILESMNAEGEKFDTVILDPPKLTRHRSGLTKAMRGYFSMNRLAVDLLKPDGILVSCSCSGLVSREVFEEMLADVSLRAGRSIQILDVRGQSADHPTSVHCVENNYLKCLVCRVE